MSPKPAPNQWLVVWLGLCLLACHVVEARAAPSVGGVEARLKRQAPARPRPAASVGLRPPSASASATGFASASASAPGSPSPSSSSSELGGEPSPDDRFSAASAADERPVDRRPPARGPDEEEPPRRPPKGSRKPPAPAPAVAARRPPVNRYRDEEADDSGEDCSDNDYYSNDHFGDMFRLAAEPMRRFSQMMGNVFERMPRMGSGDYEYANYPASNMAAASSYNDGDGYSRLASSVTNNGRTRGVVSETRNGRTETRRIGRDDSSADEADD